MSEAPGLYVHVPFCARACPYCDFDFEVGRRPALTSFVEALRREIAGRPGSPPFDTLYWGGGTPSLVGPDGFRTLFKELSPLLPGHAFREFTVECNPEHVDTPMLEALAEIGAGRVSLGVQSFAPRALEMLGRVHDGVGARAAIDLAQRAGFAVSVDLIVGWPGQGRGELRGDLEQLLAAGVDHVSTYALTIEQGTPWEGLMRRGRREDVDADVQAARLLQVRDVLCANGFEHYEISSYAKPARRAVHNRKYWNGVDYLGLGPSAASARFFGGSAGVERWQNARGLAAWAAGAPPTHERLEAPEALGEALWLGLRQLEGFEVRALCERLGVGESDVAERISRPLERGDLIQHDGRIRLAPGRWLVADSIALDLLSPPSG